MNWKAPISLTTKPKDAQFYARLNADDAWKHKYKQFCFSWQQGGPVNEPPREFAILDQTTAARNQALATSQRIQEAQAAELARRQAEAAQQIQNKIKQQCDEVNAVAILSGFAFTEDAASASDAPTGSGSTSPTEADTPSTASDSGAEAEAEASDADAAPPPPPLVTLLQASEARARKRGRGEDAKAAERGDGAAKPKRRSLKQDLEKKAKATPRPVGLQWM